jgi:hypothetical protein
MGNPLRVVNNGKLLLELRDISKCNDKELQKDSGFVRQKDKIGLKLRN